MPNFIESLRVKGFRSLADVEIGNLPRAAVLIGTNGPGKSNLVRFFEMMSWMVRIRRLNEFVQRYGGADDQLFGGSKNSLQIEAQLAIRTDSGRNEYRFTLEYAQPDRFQFLDEAFRFTRVGSDAATPWQELGRSHVEAKIVEARQSDKFVDINQKSAGVLVQLLRRCFAYQFYDTSFNSPFMTKCDPAESNYLLSNGGNLAAILLRLERECPRRFESICDYIGRCLPNFDRFQIEENDRAVLLQWKAKGMDKTFGPNLTSDGSLRLFALVTLLNLPPAMLPDLLLLDEPELGLHPAAIALVGDMIKALAEERQVIVATQSPLLVDEFDLDEIHVLELRDGRTTISRHDKKEYLHWLEKYTTGELWQKNLIGGRP